MKRKSATGKFDWKKSIQNAPSNLEEGFTIFTQLLEHNIESSIGNSAFTNHHDIA